MGAVRGLWTNEAAVARFKELLVAKETYSAIASIMNAEFGCHLTRNATIGKAHRMGLNNGRGKGFGVGVTGQHIPRRQKKPAMPRTFHHSTNRPPESELPHPFIPTPEAAEHHCTIFELTNETCRWPLGQWNEPAKLFCGDQSADLYLHRPYCAAHMRRAGGGYGGRMR